MGDEESGGALFNVMAYFVAAVVGVVVAALQAPGMVVLVITVIVVAEYLACASFCEIVGRGYIADLPTDICVFLSFWIGFMIGPYVRKEPAIAWAVRSILNVIAG